MIEIPSFFFYLGIFAVAAGSFMMAGKIRHVYKAFVIFKSFKYAYEDITGLLATLYPIGVGLKLLPLGPDFLRFHLSDIGAPLAIAEIIMILLAWVTKQEWRYTRADAWYQSRLWYARMHIRAVAVGWAVVCIYEVGVGLLYDIRAPGVKAVIIGKFDWVDIVMYTLGALCGLYLLRSYASFLRNHVIPAAASYERAKDEGASQEAARVRRDAQRRRSEGRRRQNRTRRRR